MGSSKVFDVNFNNFKILLLERNLFPQVKLALTEFLITYKVSSSDWVDTSNKNTSFESGLWMSNSMNSFLRNCDILPIFEKTFGLGHIRVGFNSKGERIFYPSPIHTIISFVRNHSGEYVLPVETISDKYTTTFIDGLYTVYDVPFIDATITASKDKLYISVVNKHYSDSINCNFDFPFKINGLDAKVFELVGDDFNLNNTPDFPDRIKIRESSIKFRNTYKFPPHSYTLFEIPVEIDLNVGGIQLFTDALFVYPNPADGFINLKLPRELNSKSKISIYNTLGQLMFSSEVDSNKTDLILSVNSFYSGIYYVVLDSGGKIFRTSFCKLN